MRNFLLLALLAMPLAAYGETKVLPAPGNAVAVIRGDEAKSQWFVIAIDFNRQRITPVTPTVIEDGASCVIEGEPGSQCAVTRFGATGQQRETLVVTLGGAVKPPDPTPQPGPGPGPQPNPPTPAPGLPLIGMRVLILQETSPSAAPIPKAQYEALWSQDIRAYLDQKAFSRWRRLDPHAPVTNLPKVWQDMRAKAATDIATTTTNPDQPWVVIAGASSAGGAESIVFSGPYPATPQEAIAFFKKYGG